MKIGDITQPLIELLRDAASAERLLDQHDDQFYRRSYIRSTVAAIEGIVWLLKQTCLKAAGEARSRLSVAEYAMLSDATYELTNNGEVRTQTKFLKLAENLRFAVNTCNRLFGTAIDLQVGTSSWEEFRTSTTIRNRITHPKDIRELQITDNEIAMCKRVVSWFNQRIWELIDALSDQSRNADSGESQEEGA